MSDRTDSNRGRRNPPATRGTRPVNRTALPGGSQPVRRPQPSSDLQTTRRVPAVTERDTRHTAVPPERRTASVRKRKNNLAVFYMVTVLVGVVVCVSLFVLGYQTLVNNNDIYNALTPTARPTSTVAVRPVYESALGMITELKTGSPNFVTLLILDNEQQLNLQLTDSSVLRNRYGSLLGFGELSPGQIVDVEYDNKTNEIAILSISAQAFETPSRGTVNFDYENMTITMGNDRFQYTEQTLVLNKGEPYPLSSITSADFFTFIGYQDTVWCIRLDSGHGYIQFENADAVINGTVLVHNVFTPLEGANIALPESNEAYRVTVEGQNIEPFIVDMIVRHGEIHTIDLVDVSFKKSTLQLVLNVPDTFVFIDGEPVTLSNNSAEVLYGEHTLRVEKDGYIPIQQNFTVNQSVTRLTLNLVPEISTVSVQINTFPSGGDVYVNGAHVGISPVTVELEYGTHRITGHKRGYYDETITVVVDANSSRAFTLFLRATPTTTPSPTPWPDIP